MCFIMKKTCGIMKKRVIITNLCYYNKLVFEKWTFDGAYNEHEGLLRKESKIRLCVLIEWGSFYRLRKSMWRFKTTLIPFENWLAAFHWLPPPNYTENEPTFSTQHSEGVRCHVPLQFWLRRKKCEIHHKKKSRMLWKVSLKIFIFPC